jgi:hypothetical protein
LECVRRYGLHDWQGAEGWVLLCPAGFRGLLLLHDGG